MYPKDIIPVNREESSYSPWKGTDNSWGAPLPQQLQDNFSSCYLPHLYSHLQIHLEGARIPKGSGDSL